jgi:hypothetical protein
MASVSFELMWKRARVGTTHPYMIFYMWIELPEEGEFLTYKLIFIDLPLNEYTQDNKKWQAS